LKRTGESPGTWDLLAFASFEHVRELRDADGRQLGELKASGSARARSATELVPCHYADERSASGLPMNAPALAQIVLHWPAILRVVGTIRAAFIVRSGMPRLSGLDLWRIVNAAASVVTFRCLERGDASVVPVADAALYKACVGIKFALRHAEVEQFGRTDAIGAYPSAESLWRYICRARLLIGSSQVCAGPAALVLELLAVLVTGPDREPDHRIAIEPIDVARLLDYADALAVWETVNLLARARTSSAGNDAGGRLHRMCLTMFENMCGAVNLAVPPDVELARVVLERRLESLWTTVPHCLTRTCLRTR
jgi:hypothetical protein